MHNSQYTADILCRFFRQHSQQWPWHGLVERKEALVPPVLLLLMWEMKVNLKDITSGVDEMLTVRFFWWGLQCGSIDHGMDRISLCWRGEVTWVTVTILGRLALPMQLIESFQLVKLPLHSFQEEYYVVSAGLLRIKNQIHLLSTRGKSL